MFKLMFAVALVGLFLIAAQAQETAFPNELEGFQFMKMDKMRDLTLLVSTKGDVAARFGADCVNGCDFDENWRIEFAYINSGWSKSDTDKGLTTVYRPKVDLVDRLVNINFRPRKPVILPESVVFPATFKCSTGLTTQGELKFKTMDCMDDRRVWYMYAIEANETAKLQKNQFIGIHYLPTEAQEKAIYALDSITAAKPGTEDTHYINASGH
jgi:hypothetical protein